jgi:hypothetical protein
VFLGMDPFIGGDSGYRLSNGILLQLHCRGLFTLGQVSKVVPSCLDSRAWLTFQDLGLPVFLKENVTPSFKF